MDVCLARPAVRGLDDGRIVGFRLTGDISGGGILRSMLWRGDDVRRFGTALARPGFSIGELVIAAAGPAR